MTPAPNRHWENSTVQHPGALPTMGAMSTSTPTNKAPANTRAGRIIDGPKRARLQAGEHEAGTPRTSKQQQPAKPGQQAQARLPTEADTVARGAERPGAQGVMR